MVSELLHRWDVSVSEAVELQRRLREQLVLRPPAGLQARLLGGADISMGRGEAYAWGGVVVLEADSLQRVGQSTARVALRFPYVPGLLSFRELPVLAEAWAHLEPRPDVLIFDGQGTAHPQRFGLACHGGLLFGVPSIPLVHQGEVVGMAVRTRPGVKPVYVSPGHLMDLDTAVQLVLRACPRYREPETTRRPPQTQ